MLTKHPEDYVWLLLTIFAVWRVTALVAYESGPFAMFSALRRGLARIGLGKLASCFYCLSLWISCCVVLVFPISLSTPLEILGVAGAVAIIERALSGAPSTGE